MLWSCPSIVTVTFYCIAEKGLAFYGRKLFRNWERMYDLKIPEICRGYCETEGWTCVHVWVFCIMCRWYSISIIDYPTFSLTTTLWASVVWTLFGRETAQCLLETSIVFYFEMFQHNNYTYRNGLVSREAHPKCHCDFPTDWYSTCLWHWLAGCRLMSPFVWM